MRKSGTASDASNFCDFIERFRLPEKIINNSFQGLTVTVIFFTFAAFSWIFLNHFHYQQTRGRGLNALNIKPTIRTSSPINLTCVLETTISKNFEFFNRPFADSTARLIFVTHLDAFASYTVCYFCPLLEKNGDSAGNPTDSIKSRESLKPLSKIKISFSFDHFKIQLSFF